MKIYRIYSVLLIQILRYVVKGNDPFDTPETFNRHSSDKLLHRKRSKNPGPKDITPINVECNVHNGDDFNAGEFEIVLFTNKLVIPHKDESLRFLCRKDPKILLDKSTFLLTPENTIWQQGDTFCVTFDHMQSVLISNQRACIETSMYPLEPKLSSWKIMFFSVKILREDKELMAVPAPFVIFDPSVKGIYYPEILALSIPGDHSSKRRQNTYHPRTEEWTKLIKNNAAWSEVKFSHKETISINSESNIKFTRYDGNNAWIIGSDVLANAKVNLYRVGGSFRAAIRQDNDNFNQSSS